MIYDDLELLGPRVLARPLSDLDVTKGGIVRPDSAKHQQNRALVEKVGPGDTKDDGRIVPLPFAVGDVVFYQKYAGAWIVLDEQERLMLMGEEIQARLPVDRVRLVHHDNDATKDHLEGEACLICFQQADSEAKTNLATMREEFVRDQSGR
jgi:chaperonin GroES